MPTTITHITLILFGLLALLILLDLVVSRDWQRFLVELGATLLGFLVLRFTTGFPHSRTPFGGVAPILVLGLIFISTLLGMAAHYIFYLRGAFSWRSFFKPLVISPIVLLPLVGSLQGTSHLQPIQTVSFALLAFQNGFFWKEVFERARPQQ